MRLKSIQIMFARFTCCAAFVLLSGLSTSAEPADDKTTPNEKARYGDQQSLFERINVLEAWEITKGDPEVLVGVIDNGYDFFHPDLKGQLNPGYYYAGGFHTEFYEGIAHGTLVSSIIVAKENGEGMVGLAPHCNVLTASQGMIEHTVVKMMSAFFRENPKATQFEWQAHMQEHLEEVSKFSRDWNRYQYLGAAEAIRYLVDHDARVINLSGEMKKSACPFPEVWEKLEDAFAYAAEKNVVIVLSAGNNAAEWEDYPGKADSMLVVGGSLLNDTRWEQVHKVRGRTIKVGSNFGKRLSVMAPVDNLMVCEPHDARWYNVKDGPMGPMKLKFVGPHKVKPIGGTSSAAPIVSSLVALVLTVSPDMDAKSVVDIIKQGCDDIGEPGVDLHTGHGRINFGKTLKLAKVWTHP